MQKIQRVINKILRSKTEIIQYCTHSDAEKKQNIEITYNIAAWIIDKI